MALSLSCVPRLVSCLGVLSGLGPFSSVSLVRCNLDLVRVSSVGSRSALCRSVGRMSTLLKLCFDGGLMKCLMVMMVMMVLSSPPGPPALPALGFGLGDLFHSHSGGLSRSGPPLLHVWFTGSASGSPVAPQWSSGFLLFCSPCPFSSLHPPPISSSLFAPLPCSKEKECKRKRERDMRHPAITATRSKR